MMNDLNNQPPKLPLHFLRWFCDDKLIEDVEGDLSELFSERKKKSPIKAKALYALDVLLLLRPGIIRNFEITDRSIRTDMIKNYLKIAARNFLRYKGFTLINILGLIVGIASSLLILLWVNDEVSVDKFHAKGDQIYQLYRNMRQTGGAITTTVSIPKPAADLMREEYPEVQDIASLSWEMNMRLEKGDKFSMEEGFYASPEFLTMFSFPFLVGDKQTALDDLNSIILSKRVAEKYFGATWKNNILGKSIVVEEGREVVITGVLEDTHNNSTLQFDWLLPAQYFYNQNSWVDDWGNGSFKVYATISSEYHADQMRDRILNAIKVHAAGQDNAGDEELILRKFQDGYLYSNFENGVIAGGRIDYVKIMIVVAIFILIVACINFMNLATARSGRRSKEIGIRKVMGAYKISIGLQFLLESFLLSFIAVLVSVLVVLLMLPFFNQLVDKNLTLNFQMLETWYFLGGIAVVVGILSGSYPAILLPTFDIMQSLKGAVKQSSFGGFLRKGLVVFQFAISTLLVIGTGVVYQQINYVLSKDLGLDKENLLGVWMEGDISQRYETYKTELHKIANVERVTVASGNPIRYSRSTSSANWEGKNPSENYEVNVLLTDEDFIETMKMEMVSGRTFSSQISDSMNFIINEVAADLMGFEDPINKRLSFWGIDGKIVGVVKNFHMRNMYQPIAPLIITCINPASSEMALIRINGDPGEALVAIEQLTSKLNPKYDFRYEFIDQVYERSYENEATIGTLAKIFSGISIVVSCLGLFGLVAFSAEQRSKEIGIRKVHGASIAQLILLLSKAYSKLIIIAFLLAIPFGYYYSQRWLNNFEFRTYLDASIFIIAGTITFIIGALTVSIKSYQAASINPVKTLRDE